MSKRMKTPALPRPFAGATLAGKYPFHELTCDRCKVGAARRAAAPKRGR